MAKQPPTSSPPPSSPRPAAPPGGGFLWLYRLLKLAGFALGLPAALLSGMALIGAFTENGWARAGGAAVAIVVLPLFIADRLLPADDPARASGLVGDVCAVTWTLIAFVVGGAANASTRPLLEREGDRLVSAGYGSLGSVAYVLAGVRVETAAGSGSGAPGGGSAAASGSAAAPPADAGPASSALADAGEARDAAAPKPKSEHGEKSPADIFRDASPSVVTIFVQSREGEGSGTGFLVDRDGTLATNHHVVDEAKHVRIKFQNGAVYDDVEILDDVAAVDLALLKINLSAPVDGGAKGDAAPLALGDSEAVVVGEHAVSIGNPLGLESTLTDGLISSRRMYEGRAWIQFSAPISPGNSGGPLFNMKAEVVGITTATLAGYGRAQNLNLAVPVNELRKLIRPTYPGRHKVADGSAPSHW